MYKIIYIMFNIKIICLSNVLFLVPLFDTSFQTQITAALLKLEQKSDRKRQDTIFNAFNDKYICIFIN